MNKAIKDGHDLLVFKCRGISKFIEILDNNNMYAWFHCCEAATVSSVHCMIFIPKQHR